MLTKWDADRCLHCGADVWWGLPRAEDPCYECHCPVGKPLRRTDHTNAGSVTYESSDGGRTWVRASFMSASERARREQFAYDMHRIQVELK